jgi:hypothetical protein
MHIFRPHAREHKPSGTYVVEVDVFGAGVGHPAPLTYQGHPTCTPHLRQAARFATVRQAQEAGKVPPALEPLLVKLTEGRP